jgi:hypothetical protein
VGWSTVRPARVVRGQAGRSMLSAQTAAPLGNAHLAQNGRIVRRDDASIPRRVAATKTGTPGGSLSAVRKARRACALYAGQLIS